MGRESSVVSTGGVGVEVLVSRGNSTHPDDLTFIRDRRVGRLATADAQGKPSVVPVVSASFTMDEEPVIAIAIDEKPKGDPRALRRVRNILQRSEVALVVDEYHEDWDALAWVLVRGSASLIEPGAAGHAEALAALRQKYPQYARMRLEERPAIVIRRLSTSSWRGAGLDDEQPSPRPGREELATLVRGRRSVRAFETTPIPRAINHGDSSSSSPKNVATRWPTRWRRRGGHSCDSTGRTRRSSRRDCRRAAIVSRGRRS